MDNVEQSDTYLRGSGQMARRSILLQTASPVVVVAKVAAARHQQDTQWPQPWQEATAWTEKEDEKNSDICWLATLTVCMYCARVYKCNCIYVWIHFCSY